MISSVGFGVLGLRKRYRYRCCKPSSRGLSPIFKLLPLLYRIEEQEEALFRMTEEQERLLDFLGDNDRAMIRGVAGSGKTKLAMASAQRFADEGKKVLFLCFNRMLADWLKAERPEQYDGRITICTYHQLCYEWCHRAGLVQSQPRLGRG